MQDQIDLKNKINPLDHTGLAMKMASRYIQNGKLYGYTSQDLFQVAMVGVLRACEVFDPRRGKFSTICHFYIKDELNKMFYTGHTRTLKPIETPLSTYHKDIDKYSLLDSLQTDFEEEEADLFVEEFCSKIELEGDNREFFLEMMQYGLTEATHRFKERTGLTHQAVHYRIKRIRSRLKPMYIRSIGNPILGEPEVKIESGVKGINWSFDKRSWRVFPYIRSTKKQKHLGYFKDLEGAKKALQMFRRGIK